MRQGNTLPTVIVMVLTFGIGIYFIASFWQAMTQAYTTTITYSYSVSESVDAKGIFLREEYVLPSSSGILDILRREGEQVGVGQVVGRTFQSVDAMLEQNQLEVLLDEVEVLEYAFQEQMDISTVNKVDKDIISAISTLRGSVATGSYQKLEEELTAVQGTVLRRDYIFGSALQMKELEDRYDFLLAQVYAMSQGSNSGVNYVTTPVSGAYSILVDGLEHIGLDQAMDFSLTELQDLLDQGVTGSIEGTGKIITGNSWYFVTYLDREWTHDLYPGAFVNLRFSGDFSQDISMKVEKIGEIENGTQLIVLSSDRYLEQTTLLRLQTAELVYHTYTGLRIPKEALRMEQYVNQETGETREEFGVYVVSAGYADFTPVRILTEGNDYFVVASEVQNAYSLRAGQEIVVHAVGIYDGKLLFY